MLIGLLSDTHDRLDAMKLAIATLQNEHAEYFIHCGDVGGEQILDQLAGLPAAFVWGNNDYERLSLARYAESLKINCLGAFGQLTLDGKLFAITHGDDPALKRGLIESQQFDYFLQGHTHIPIDRRQGRTRIINPGALHRANPKTVAILDTSNDSLRFIELSQI